MKLGEIKLEALRLMFMNYNDDLKLENFDNYLLNENYASYLVNMNGSINRCFSSIEEKCVLPSKSHKFLNTEGTQSGAFIRFDLDNILNDYSTFDRVIYENNNGDYNGEYDYKLEGNTLVLDKIDDGESYTLLYKPSISRISNDNSNDEIEYKYTFTGNNSGYAIAFSAVIVAKLLPVYTVIGSSFLILIFTPTQSHTLDIPSDLLEQFLRSIHICLRQHKIFFSLE